MENELKRSLNSVVRAEKECDIYCPICHKLLHVQAGDDNRVILRIPTIDLTAQQRASLNGGNAIHFNFASKVMHLFDPSTEKSLIDA